MSGYDDAGWDDDNEKDDYWDGADKDVVRDAEGHLVISEQGGKIDARWYTRGWTVVIGTGVMVALVLLVFVLVTR